MKNKIFTYEDCAEDILKAANKWESRKNDHPEVADAYIDDANDLREVAEAARTGDIEKTWEKIKALDTIIRECIPQASWDYLTKQAWCLRKSKV